APGTPLSGARASHADAGARHGPGRHGLSFLHVSRESPPCSPGDWHASDQPDPCHGGWDHRPLLDGSRTVGVACAAAALDTSEATWASLAYLATPDCAVGLVTTVQCRATAFTMAAFNVLVQWHGLRPYASGFVPLSIAEFSL